MAKTDSLSLLTVLTILLLLSSLIVETTSQGQSDAKQKNRVKFKEMETELFLSGDNIIVKFEGKNPHTKFYLNKYNDSEKVFYKIVFKSLNELDSQGKQVNPSLHSFNALESQNFSHQVLTEETEDTRVIEVAFVTTLQIDGVDVKIRFRFSIYSFEYLITLTNPNATMITNMETSLTNANTTEAASTHDNLTVTSIEVAERVIVKSATEVKFDVEIFNWPFLAKTKFLELDIRLISIHQIRSTQVEDEDQVTETTNIESVEGGTPDG